MKKSDGVNEIPASVVIDFLTKTLPFSTLDKPTLWKFCEKCTVDFFPKGTLIFKQGQTAVSHFFVIQTGGVKSYLLDDEGSISLKDFRGPGEYFGALPIIQGTRANLNVETVDDTFCFLFNKQDFLNLLQSNPKVSQYYLRSMSEKMAGMVYSELRQKRIALRTEGALYLFSAQVGAMAKGKLYTSSVTTTVQKAAVVMSDNRIGSLLITDADGKIVGIVTDKDIRSKVVARGIDYKTRVSEIMSSPVQTISSQAICFDACLR